MNPGQSSPAVQPGQEVPRRIAVMSLIAMVAIYLFSFFQRAAIPGTIFNELQRDWHLSASAVTALGSTFLWIYGSMQIFVGLVVDRFGGKRTLLIGALVMATGSALFPLAPSVPWLYVARALTAFGASVMYLCVVKEVSYMFPHRLFAPVIGATVAVGYCGGIIAMLPFERAASYFGWRESLIVAGLATFLVTGVSALALRRLPAKAPAGTEFSLRPLWDIVRGRQNWPMLIIGMINFPVYFVIQSGLGKKFMQDFAGLSSKDAATFTLIMMVISALCVLTGGAVLNLFGHRRRPLLFLSTGMILASLALMLTGVLVKGPAWMFLAGYIFLAVSNISNPVGSTLMKELNEPGYVAQAIALLNGLTYLGVAALLSVTGLILDLYKSGSTTTADGIIYPPGAYGSLLATLTFFTLISLATTFYVNQREVEPVIEATVNNRR